MTVVTTRPTSTVANGSSTIGGGAASRHAATSDSSDFTWITLTGTTAMQLGMAAPTIPAGAQVKAIALRGRSDAPGTSGLLLASIVSPAVGPAFLLINWASLTTTTLLSETYSADPGAVTASLGLVLGSGNVEIAELYFDTTYVAKPVVTPSAPTGTITTTNLPPVIWADTLDSDGGVQTSYEAKVFNSTQYGAGGFSADTSSPVTSSGIQTGADTTWTPTTRLPNATYRAYVRVAQTVNGATFWSDWAYSGFVINAPLPGTPGLTLVAEDALGHILIDPNPTSGAVTTDLIEIEYSLDGVTWASLRTEMGDGSILPSEIGFDYEAPNGTAVSYRVRAVHSATAPYTVSDWTTASSTWASTRQWLKHPNKPLLNLEITIATLPTRKNQARQGVFQPLGRRDPIVVADSRTTDTGDIVLDVPWADQDALAALLNDGGALLLQTPATSHFDDTYLFAGDLDNKRTIDKAFAQGTLAGFSWTEVARPGGDVEAWPPGS